MHELVGRKTEKIIEDNQLMGTLCLVFYTLQIILDYRGWLFQGLITVFCRSRVLFCCCSVDVLLLLRNFSVDILLFLRCSFLDFLLICLSSVINKMVSCFCSYIVVSWCCCLRCLVVSLCFSLFILTPLSLFSPSLTLFIFTSCLSLSLISFYSLLTSLHYPPHPRRATPSPAPSPGRSRRWRWAGPLGDPLRATGVVGGPGRSTRSVPARPPSSPVGGEERQ